MEHKTVYTKVPSDENEDARGDPPRTLSTSINKMLIVTVAISFLINIAMLISLKRYQRTVNGCKPSFSGLGYDTEVEYYPESRYSNDNHTARDGYWEALDTSPIIVALTDHIAEKAGLDIAPVRYPWDDSKGVYHVKVFHQIHCLKNIHRAYTDFITGSSPSVSPPHIFHCLDALLQDIKCVADDTPMTTYLQKHHIGNGQKMKCRNYERLVEWTQESQRNACFKMLTDYGSVPNTLEQFAFCPPESDSEPVQRAYFKKYGHKDPWGRDPTMTK